MYKYKASITYSQYVLLYNKLGTYIFKYIFFSSFTKEA